MTFWSAQGRFTIAVFQDAGWAERGVDALRNDGFGPESLSVMGLESTANSVLIHSVVGAQPGAIELTGLGSVIAAGPLVEVLRGTDDSLTKLGLGAAMGRAGFLPHDGYIFEALVSRGGVLVAVQSESRAADALAKLHSYGGGNAAIGAWTGRL
jgi:hypothetical protein